MGPTLGPGPYAGGAGGAAPRWCILIYTLNRMSIFLYMFATCIYDVPICLYGFPIFLHDFPMFLYQFFTFLYVLYTFFSELIRPDLT